MYAKRKKSTSSFDDISKKDASGLIDNLLRNRTWPYGKSDVPARPQPTSEKQFDWLRRLCDQLGYLVPQVMLEDYPTDQWSKDMKMLRRHININSIAMKKYGTKLEEIVKYVKRTYPDLMEKENKKKWTKAAIYEAFDARLALEWKWGTGNSTRYSPLVQKPTITPEDMLEFMQHYGGGCHYGRWEPVRVSPKVFQACMMAYKMFDTTFGWDEMNIRAAGTEGMEAAQTISTRWNSLSIQDLRHEFFKHEGNSNKAVNLFAHQVRPNYPKRRYAQSTGARLIS